MDNLIWLYRAVAAYTTKLQAELNREPLVKPHRLLPVTRELLAEKMKFDHIHGEIHKDFKQKKDSFEYWSERLSTETDFMAYLKEQSDA